MKKVISCLLLIALCLSSLLAMIPASADEVEKVNLMYGGLDPAATETTQKPGADAQFAGNGNVFYYDYWKYVDVVKGGTFDVLDAADEMGGSGHMIRFDTNDGSGTASVCDGVKGSGVFLHKVGTSYTVESTGIEYKHMFGYSFKESVIADHIKIWLPLTAITGEGDYTCTISKIDVYGASHNRTNEIYAREAEKTLLASFDNVKDQPVKNNIYDAGSTQPSSAIVLEATLDEALQLDYILFGVQTEGKYKFYEIELDGILATQRDAAITDFNNNPLKQQYARITGTEEEYTEGSWSVLEEALAQTDPVNQNCLATLTELEAAAAILKPAIDQLRAKPADKTELLAAINGCSSLKETDYTPNTWSALALALNAAVTIRDADEYAYTQSAVDAATKAINDARAALATKPDKTELAAEIAKLANYKEADYTQKTWAALNTALEAAKKVNENVNATKEEVDTAKANLASAYAALAKPGNKDALKTEIEKAKALNQEDFESVTALAWELLQMEIQNAEAVIADDNATQADVDNALAELKAQLDNLIPKAAGGDGSTNATEEATEQVQETTPETEAPDKKSGCGSAVATTAAVIGLVSALGTALVVKRKED